MDVAIIGASGDCGREIAGQLIASRLLAPTERLQLVGRGGGASARILHGLASDLTDAHAEHVPDIDIVLSPDEVVADIWVIACGATLPPVTDGLSDRRSLANLNAPVFAQYAAALSRRGQGHEIALIVSNPVELGVALFAERIERHRVIGIGAYQDTLRFRREIAADLGIRRQRVGAFMLGEHGEGQLPVWSSVQVIGLDDDELSRAVAQLRGGLAIEDFAELCRNERTMVASLLAEGRVADAFARIEKLSPDLRVVLKPYITHLSGSKTVMATANVTIALLRILLEGQEALLAGQVALHAGEFYDFEGVLGVPIVLSGRGVSRIVEIPLTPPEKTRLSQISQDINTKITHWTAKRHLHHA